MAPVEHILGRVATRRDATAPPHGNRPKARHALLICACVTLEDAPIWLIYDDRDDGALVWGRVPPVDEVSDLVDAQFSAGGHADPSDVLAWLEGVLPYPWMPGGGGGHSAVLTELGRKIRDS